MGLFDQDTDEQSNARLEQIKSLVSELNEAAEKQERALAAIEAVKHAGMAWLDGNKALIVGGYETLIDSIAAGNEDLAEGMVGALGKAAGIAVHIPVDTGSGEPVSVAEMAAVAFPYNSDAARSFRLAKNNIPASVFEGADPAAHLTPKEKIRFEPEAGEMSLLERINGKRREAHLARIDELTKEADARKVSYPLELAEAETAKDAALTEVRRKLEQLARHHFRLRSALLGGDIEAMNAAFADMESAAMTGEVMDVCFIDENGAEIDPVDAALVSFKRGEDRAAAYLALIAHGVPPQPGKIMTATFAVPDSMGEHKMPPGPAQTVLADIYREQGAAGFEKFIRETYEGGPSLLERAVDDDILLQAVLLPLGNDLVKAMLMLKAADRAASQKSAATLKKKAMELAGGGVWLRLSDHEIVRLTAIGRAANEDGSDVLSYISETAKRTVPGSDAGLAAAALDFLARQPGFIRVGDNEVFRPDQAIMASMSRDGGDMYHFNYLLRDGVHDVMVDDTQVREIFTQLENAPGWFRSGGQAFNAARIDNLWISGKGEYEDDKTVTLSFIAAGKTSKTELKEQAATELLANLVVKSGFVKIGTEFLNMRTVGDTWYEAPESGGKGQIKYSTGVSKGTVAKNISKSDAMALLDSLAEVPGNLRAGDYSVVRPELFDAMSARSGENKLRFGLGGKVHSADMNGNTAKRLVTKFATAARNRENPDYIEDEKGSLVKISKISSAWHSAAEGKFKFILSGAEWVSAADKEQAQALLADLAKADGFMTREDGTCMNANACDSFWHDGKALYRIAGGVVWSSKTVSEKEGLELIAKTVAPPVSPDFS